METFAVLIEYQVEDGRAFETSVQPMLGALRSTTPLPPINVTAFAGHQALTVLAAGGVDHGKLSAMTNDDKANVRGELDLTHAVWEAMVPPGQTLDEYAELATVTHTDGVTYTLLRKNTDPDAVVLIFNPAEWDAFAKGVRDGEFDLPEEWSTPPGSAPA